MTCLFTSTFLWETFFNDDDAVYHTPLLPTLLISLELTNPRYWLTLISPFVNKKPGHLLLAGVSAATDDTVD